MYISDLVILVSSGNLVERVDELHEEIAVDNDENAQKADHYSPCLVPVDTNSIQVVVNDEHEQRACYMNRVQ